MNILYIVLMVFLLPQCKPSDQVTLVTDQTHSAVSVGSGSDQTVTTASPDDLAPIETVLPTSPVATSPEPTREVPIGQQVPVDDFDDENTEEEFVQQVTNEKCEFTSSELKPFTSYPDSCQGYVDELSVMNRNISLFAGGDSRCCETNSDCIKKTITSPNLFGGGCPANINLEWFKRWEQQKSRYQDRIDVLYEKHDSKNCLARAILCLQSNPQLRCVSGQCVR